MTGIFESKWDLALTPPSAADLAAGSAYRELGAHIVARATGGFVAAEFLAGTMFRHDSLSTNGLSADEARAEVLRGVPHWWLDRGAE